MNLEIIDVDPAIRGALGLLANGLGHPVNQLQVEGVLLRHLVLGRELQAVLVVLRKLNRIASKAYSTYFMAKAIQWQRKRFCLQNNVNILNRSIPVHVKVLICHQWIFCLWMTLVSQVQDYQSPG